MNIFDDIEKEHSLFEKAAGSLVTLVTELKKTDTLELRQNIKSLCNFFITFMVAHHTRKEEDVIFNALQKLDLPRDKGPLYYYELEHREHLKHAEEILAILDSQKLTDDDKTNLYNKATSYCGEIWEHIDKENSVLITEVLERVRGLALIEMNKSYEKFMNDFKFSGSTAASQQDIVQQIIAKYPPVLSVENHIRGDGCMSCRFYGDGCNGIEHEWWTEHEWEDFYERNDRD